MRLMQNTEPTNTPTTPDPIADAEMLDQTYALLIETIEDYLDAEPAPTPAPTPAAEDKIFTEAKVSPLLSNRSSRRGKKRVFGIRAARGFDPSQPDAA